MSLIDRGFSVRIPADMAELEPELIAQGAEALTFVVDCCEGPYPKCVAKYRPPKPYRIAELDQPLRKRRTNAEVRVLRKLADAQIACPRVVSVDDKQGLIYMELIKGQSLKQVTWDASDVSSVRPLFIRFGELVAGIHALNIAHGDLTTSNAMVDSESGELKLIDFGLASQSANVEEKAVDIYVLERAIASTHPDSANQLVDAVLMGYQADPTSHTAQVMNRLQVVRQRGRKRAMLG
ncbi:EKC/KEOPS complex subunit BUD32 [Wickerhamiella sorbophila]|uniref:EKC/KEOPS complex subunit BUD32 n=1 Tax=Wickerhamiella sorbophila TaxID=45607 RepID=A0A2T0FG32_9ASCO|nr:EKC/KEOPS complex subunit BUD32 [Wickerhamiella sorbophila]PRT53951.1 EKC/KEOPS complex subunit BUD32 [Wickerhamiella sorbophila]